MSAAGLQPLGRTRRSRRCPVQRSNCPRQTSIARGRARAPRRDWRRADLLPRESTSQHRCYAEHVEEPPGDALSRDSRRLRSVVQRRHPVAHRGRRFEYALFARHVLERGVTDVAHGVVRVSFPDERDPIAVRVWRRGEQRRSRDRIDGGRRANTEGKREDDERGQRGRASERAKRHAHAIARGKSWMPSGWRSVDRLRQRPWREHQVNGLAPEPSARARQAVAFRVERKRFKQVADQVFAFRLRNAPRQERSASQGGPSGLIATPVRASVRASCCESRRARPRVHAGLRRAVGKTSSSGLHAAALARRVV